MLQLFSFVQSPEVAEMVEKFCYYYCFAYVVFEINFMRSLREKKNDPLTNLHRL